MEYRCNENQIERDVIVSYLHQSDSSCMRLHDSNSSWMNEEPEMNIQ